MVVANAGVEWSVFSVHESLVSLLQLVFETTIPEEILTVKSLSNLEKRRMARWKKTIEPCLLYTSPSPRD